MNNRSRCFQHINKGFNVELVRTEIYGDARLVVHMLKQSTVKSD